MLKKNINELLTALTTAQEKGDYTSMAEHYLALGKAYKEDGKIAKAIYYLNRFDNLVSGEDDLYETFEDEDDLAMQWTEELEAIQTPYEKAIQAQAAEKAENLKNLQKMQWLLLTMSRFCTLFQHISMLSDFEGLEKLTEIIDYFSKGLYGELNEKDADHIEEELTNYDDLLEEIFDSPLMCDYTQKVEIPCQPSFIAADLESGDIGTYFFSMVYAALQSFIFHEPTDNIEMEFVACGILADYYYRTSDADLKDIPKIQEETNRIFSDYDFVKSEPTFDKFQERINTYKKIMLV